MEIFETITINYKHVSTNRKVDLLAAFKQNANGEECLLDDYFQVYEDALAIYFLHVISNGNRLLAETAIILKTASLLRMDDMRRVYHLNNFRRLKVEIAEAASFFPAWHKADLRDIFGESFAGFYQQELIGEELPMLQFKLEEDLPFTPLKWSTALAN